MLSKSEHIRRVLNKNFDMPAAEVADRLQDKGVEIDPGLVHVVRSAMRKERQQAEEQKQAEANQRRQEKEAEKAKLRAMAAKVQETKALNPLPLRQHIIDAVTGYEQYTANLGQRCQGLTIPEVIVRCEKTYKFDDKEKFNQNVRKKLRLLVLSGELVPKEGNKFGLSTTVIQKNPRLFDQRLLESKPQSTPDAADLGVRRQDVVAGTENGIAFLVGKLKEIVAKVGKKETKELIDVL